MRSTFIALVAVAFVTGTLISEAQSAPRPATSPVPPGVNFSKVSLGFEANRGQAAPQASFISRGTGYTALLTGDGMVLALRAESKIQKDGTATSTRPIANSAAVVQFRIMGISKNVTLTGEGLRPGHVNYFIGNNPSQWRRNVPIYSQVRYANVYPGIDLVYYGTHQQLEYDFEVAPGADPTQIRFEIKGATRARIDENNNLVLQIGSAQLRLQAPTVYQQAAGQRSPMTGGYVLDDANHFSFHLAHYDSSKALVIDPVLAYSTYLGGSDNDQPNGIAVDAAGNVYVAGVTYSGDFPGATLGSLPSGNAHAFVAKLDPTGSNLIYADYLGGSNQDCGYALALDSANNVYVTGSTDSSDFPVVHPFMGTYPGASNAFLSKISPDGSSLLYSTYLGGNGSDVPSKVAVDASGEMIVAGITSSTNFPAANAFQSGVAPNEGGLYGNYGFLTKFTPDGSALVYSTYLGGSSNVALNCGGTPCWPEPQSVISDMAVDANGNAYVAGNTNTYNFPTTVGSYLTADSTQMDSNVGFVTKFGASGGLAYSTYFYESSGLFTNISAIATDASGAAYVTGAAISDGTFPITSTAICDPSVYGWGCSFAFVAKFDASAATLLYSTFLGPNNNASPRSIALDGNGDAYVLAVSQSDSFNTVNPIQGFTNSSDMLLVEIDPVAGAELFATYLGDSGQTQPAALAIDAAGNVYVAGSTSSSDFPATQGAFQSVLGGGTDAVLLKISPPNAPAVTLTPSSLQFATQQIGTSSQPQTVLLRNMGSSALTISSLVTSSDFSETDDCGNSVAAASGCTLTISFSPVGAGLRNGTVAIQDDAAGSPHVVSLSGTGLGSAGITLSPSTLTFSSQPLGTSSSPQVVTITSSGTTSLNISGVQVTGDFTGTNNCPSSLTPNASCTVSLTFTPTAAGARTGALTITDNAQSGTQMATLTGSGADFSISSSPSSATVTAGSSANYILTIAEIGGNFNQAVKLSCSGAPANSSCSLGSSSVVPGSSSVNVAMTIGTTAPHSAMAAARVEKPTLFYALWLQFNGLGIFGLVFAGSKRGDKNFRMLLMLAVLVGLVVLTGCAGGTGIAQQQGGTTPGTYTITVSGLSGSLQHSTPVKLTVQ